jgi:hypothetical protein
VIILWHSCTKKMLWSQRNSHLLTNGCVIRNNGVTVGNGVSYAVRAETITRFSCHYRRVLRQQLEEEEVGVNWPPACEDVSPGAGERPLVKTQQTETT